MQKSEVKMKKQNFAYLFRWASHREILEKGTELGQKKPRHSLNFFLFKDSIASSATLRALERCLFILCLDERSQNWTDEDRSQVERRN